MHIRARFAADFMFQLSRKEAEILVSQNVIPSRRSLGGYLPYVFTEQGVAMLSSVLKSERAVQMNILIIRAFVRLREILATHKDLARKMQELERQQQEHGAQIAAIYNLVEKLMTPPHRPRRPIGFVVRTERT